MSDGRLAIESGDLGQDQFIFAAQLLDQNHDANSLQIYSNLVNQKQMLSDKFNFNFYN